MANVTTIPAYTTSSSPDYSGLVKFLIEPFLESKESISVDCELIKHNLRVWVRVAIEGADKGKVYGRGGRNLQAIRTVLETAATAAGQSLHIEIYESESNDEQFRPEPPKRKPSINNERRSHNLPMNGKQRSRRPAPPKF
ncbi:RNA-binding protein [Aphanothece hegewaldii CCALA 016]|uniref:RNA-binding protein n=1 Tax=Aphanothece hegewaldii CCALA 016 TaxID=2107694 RepID=A0A2T1LZD6_9CHRO|nr:KH domain-containing protein [Aphanothece hegewaldii]PSF37775.1 RNA-binding protein [Aphanothece hegewaldii CCALA 016]